MELVSSLPDLSCPKGIQGEAPASVPDPVTVSKHDRHNLELKVSLTCTTERQNLGIDIFLFLPKTLHITEWSKQELRQDFHGRLRLAMQEAASRHEATVYALRTKVSELLARFALAESGEILDQLLAETRRLGAVVGELLKYEARSLKQELLAVASRSRRSLDPERTLADIEEILRRIDAIVQQTASLAHRETAHQIPVMRLLGEYIHHLYMDFLVGICREQAAMGAPETEPLKTQWRDLFQFISKLRLAEAKSFESFEQAGPKDAEVAQELKLLRLSQIKKFFQSQMFIEVARKETIRRFSEPAAAGAAAFAAMWAGAFEYFSQPQMRSVGFQGTVVLCTGVALYVLKDRLKDKFRAVFTRKLETILPEAEQSLVAEGKLIGRVREWFRVLALAQIPASVARTRRKGDLTLAESHIPEDVIHYGQEFQLEPAANSYGEFERSIQQILRVNIERFLKHLDDAYKTVSIMDREGDFKFIKGHRIYHFHAAVVVKKIAPGRRKPVWGRGTGARVDSAEPMTETLYRIVVDKNGIERVEPV